MHDGPTIDTDWAYRGVDAAIMENDYLRIVLLPGKGSDVIEFRDKRRDTNVLFDPPWEWTPPADRGVPAEDVTTWQPVTDEFNAQGAHAAAIRDALIGLTRAHVRAYLARRISPAFLGRHPACPDLGEDMLAIARWRIVPHMPSMIRHYERHQNKLAKFDTFQSWIVGQYESISPSIDKLVFQLTLGLELWLTRYTDIGVDGT